MLETHKYDVVPEMFHELLHESDLFHDVHHYEVMNAKKMYSLVVSFREKIIYKCVCVCVCLYVYLFIFLTELADVTNGLICKLR